MVYFADQRWWEWHRDREEFRGHPGIKASIINTGYTVTDPAVHIFRNADTATEQGGLSSDPSGLRTGSNSGYQAVGIAIGAGAVRLLLLGFDMKFDGARSHWHAGHRVQVDQQMYRSTYLRHFRELAPVLQKLGVSLINCSPGGLLSPTYPFMPIEVALP